ncbi:hypothetical protein ATANTOWER_018670 [Ataeniobius toweri]|uniref:Uncharacterized protein n=1 Tax=Ataeniobius toweri TaxID=208326 RepID=A0ABU7BGD4_9TELE|nr:hypothetical protein [Ataeniobius toweri]
MAIMRTRTLKRKTFDQSEVSFGLDIGHSCSADSTGSSSHLTQCRQSDYGQLLSACSLLLQTMVRLRIFNKFPKQTGCFIVVLFCVFWGKCVFEQLILCVTS